MMSHGENEAANVATFNLFSEYYVKFKQCFCSKTDHFMGNLGANTIKHVSDMELYIILSTLEKFKHWNRTFLITKYQYWQVKQCLVHGHHQYFISVGFSTQNKYYFHYFIQRTGCVHYVRCSLVKNRFT